MKQVTLCALALLALAFVVAGCRNTPSHGDRGGADSTLLADTAADSTVYGVCGEGTAMHTLELITDAGDTLRYVLGEDEDGRQDVQGGLLVGDRLAVIEGQAVDGDPTARRVINLTTLLGKWTSLDKNFEILEGGVVKSSVKAERNPWTSWKILNGQLLLNRDTFSIGHLGSDSLYLENREGIFVYKRQK